MLTDVAPLDLQRNVQVSLSLSKRERISQHCPNSACIFCTILQQYWPHTPDTLQQFWSPSPQTQVHSSMYLKLKLRNTGKLKSIIPRPSTTPVSAHLPYWRSKSLSHSKMVHAHQTGSFSYPSILLQLKELLNHGPDIATVHMSTNT